MEREKTNDQLLEELQELRESGQKFSMAFYSSPCLLAITRVKDGQIHEVNEAYVKITGYSRGELVGRSTLDIGIWEHPEARSRFLERIKELGKCCGQEVRLRTKSNSIRTVLLSGSFDLTIANEPHLITSGTDITERKQMEDERVVLVSELEEALRRIKTLNGILPICAHCKRIRDSVGDWHLLEEYIRERSDADFSHGICPECLKDQCPGLVD